MSGTATLLELLADKQALVESGSVRALVCPENSQESKMGLKAKTLLGLTVLAAFYGAAPASAIPVTDTVDPANALITFGSSPACPAGFACGTSSLSFVHDIRDTGFTVGDIITSATLDIHLTDLTTTGTNQETYRYDIGTQTFSCLHGNCVPNPGVIDNLVLSASSLTDLATDGMISIAINSLSGDFFFADSVLTAQVGAGGTSIAQLEAADVPVPSTLLILGAGLAAFGWRFRRAS